MQFPHEARLMEMVFPDHTNHLGTLFGGQALAWMDKAAFIVASRYARRTVVTARSEEVNFRVPVRSGQLVELVASVVKVGRSSMTVDVEMTAEDPLSGDRRVCTTGRFMMIALDSNGSPNRNCTITGNPIAIERLRRAEVSDQPANSFLFPGCRHVRANNGYR
jgi:acyl-CoA hydrolase